MSLETCLFQCFVNKYLYKRLWYVNDPMLSRLVFTGVLFVHFIIQLSIDSYTQTYIQKALFRNSLEKILTLWGFVWWWYQGIIIRFCPIQSRCIHGGKHSSKGKVPKKMWKTDILVLPVYPRKNICFLFYPIHIWKN